VYDHEPEEVDALGWDEFVTRQWESIFAGYRSKVGLRKMCRRWSDLFEVGLGCSQEIADLLVKAEIVGRGDRDLEGTADSQALVAEMTDVLADLRTDLLQLDEMDAELIVRLLGQHALLLTFIHAYALGDDVGETLEI
jgi:hypothetical protein